MKALFIALILMASNGDDLSEGKTIFEGVCGTCHQLPDPKSLTQKQWRIVLSTMKKRFVQNGLEPLSEGEQNALLLYLEYNKKGK